MTPKNFIRILIVFTLFSSSVNAQKFNNPSVGSDVVFDEEGAQVGRDEDGSHCKDAGNNAYLEILPDTRVTHGDKLITGENFSNVAGQMGILHYRVKINKPGRYYVWVRAYSCGTEDNGLGNSFLPSGASFDIS